LGSGDGVMLWVEGQSDNSGRLHTGSENRCIAKWQIKTVLS